MTSQSSRLGLAILLVAGAPLLPMPAGAQQPQVFSAFINTASFPNPNRPTDLVIVRNDNTLDSAANNCPDLATCATMYRLEDRDTYRTYDIQSVQAAGTTLTATLSQVPAASKKLTFVAFNLKATPKIGYLEVLVTPQLMQLDVDETESFEGLRSPVIVQYHPLTNLTINQGDEAKVRAAMSSALSITDPGEFDRPYQGYVTSIAPIGASSDFFQLTISGAPRGKKLNLQIGGLEKFNNQPVQAAGAIQTIAIPKGRDDATLFFKVSADANDVKHDHKYILDTRIHDVWRAGQRWNIGPTLDATVGNQTSKAPNVGALSIDLRYFIKSDNPNFRSNLTFSPIFRTDRTFHNEEIGTDVAYEGIIPPLERSLDQRRKAEKRLNGPPLARVWGWKLRPSVGLELGRRIKNADPALDNKQFSRARAGLSAGLEFGKWSFTTSITHRVPFRDEVAVADDGKTVVEVTKTPRTYARVDLSYDLGVVSLALTHLNGRQPPSFSSTHSTSLGLTFKF